MKGAVLALTIIAAIAVTSCVSFEDGKPELFAASANFRKCNVTDEFGERTGEFCYAQNVRAHFTYKTMIDTTIDGEVVYWPSGRNCSFGFKYYGMDSYEEPVLSIRAADGSVAKGIGMTASAQKGNMLTSAKPISDALEKGDAVCVIKTKYGGTYRFILEGF